MITVNIDKQSSIATLVPHGALSKDDFTSISNTIDPYIEENGHLSGLVIHTKDFPGWDSFGALTAHLKFVKQHHTEIDRVALSTDSKTGNVAESLANHFVKAEVKTFSFDDVDAAKHWASEKHQAVKN
jgi:hypothetical protein